MLSDGRGGPFSQILQSLMKHSYGISLKPQVRKVKGNDIWGAKPIQKQVMFKVVKLTVVKSKDRRIMLAIKES